MESAPPLPAARPPPPPRRSAIDLASVDIILSTDKSYWLRKSPDRSNKRTICCVQPNPILSHVTISQCQCYLHRKLLWQIAVLALLETWSTSREGKMGRGLGHNGESWGEGTWERQGVVDVCLTLSRWKTHGEGRSTPKLHLLLHLCLTHFLWWTILYVIYCMEEPITAYQLPCKPPAKEAAT